MPAGGTVYWRKWGTVPYPPLWDAMKQFTASRDETTPDELWIVEHPPVYTVGLNGKQEHLPASSDIPIIHIDRGGQITYHGPGQVVIYALVDLRRRGYGVRQLVERMEGAVIELLAQWNIEAVRRPNAPGVYIAAAKVAALGLRIKNGCSYHGLSLNVAMDLSPFLKINPCGYAGMPVTQLSEHGVDQDPDRVGEALATILAQQIAG